MIGFKLSFFVYSMIVLSYCSVIHDANEALQEYAEVVLNLDIDLIFKSIQKYPGLKKLNGYSLQTKGVDANYVPRGRVFNIGDLPIYEAPDNVNRRRMLIAVYDIFGFSHPNIKQITDLMALQGGGFRTILPDFFRGQHAELTGSIE